MRLVFFGTPEFAVPSLRALSHAGHEIAGVVTQPDRARGRHHSQLLPSPVKQFASTARIEIAQPERPRGDEFAAWLRARDADLGVVVAYGHLLRPDILSVPRLGMVNVHASLLPRWRGAAPVQWAIHAGDRETGVSIMQMEAGLDSGPVYLRRATPIAASETGRTLTTRLAELGAKALLDALPLIAAGRPPEPQDESKATYAPKLTRELARIDWSADADAIARRVRAFDPVPGAWTTLGGAEVKLYGGGPAGLSPVPALGPVPPGFGPVPAVPAGLSPVPAVPAGLSPVAPRPGTPLPGGDTLAVVCGSGTVAFTEIQPAGRKRMRTRDWLNGGGLRAGDRFE